MATNYTAMTPRDYRETAERHRQMAEGASPAVAKKLLKIAKSCENDGGVAGALSALAPQLRGPCTRRSPTANEAGHFRKMAAAEAEDALRAQLLKLAADYDDVAAEMEKQGHSPRSPDG